MIGHQEECDCDYSTNMWQNVEGHLSAWAAVQALHTPLDSEENCGKLWL